MTSQQVVDAIRLLISQGKKLAEIGEIICDHCLAPDTNSGSGFGCDNMTILIVGLLHGKNEEEWYQWVTERTNKGHGYNTPKELPQLYPAGRLEAFRRRQAAYLANEQRRKEANNEDNRFQGNGIQPPIVRFLGALTENGIQNNPMYGFLSGGSDEMDEDDDDDEQPDLLDNSTGKEDIHKILRRQLDELESDSDDEFEESEDSQSHPGESPVAPESKKTELQGEAPPPPSQPSSLPNGVTHQPQLKSDPGGDAPSDAVRAEGLLDKSEDPLKATA